MKKKKKRECINAHRSKKLPLPFDVIEYVYELERFVVEAMPELAKKNAFNEDIIESYVHLNNVRNTLEFDGYNFNPMSDEHITEAPYVCEDCKAEIANERNKDYLERLAK